jgi:hypothetical protein
MKSSGLVISKKVNAASSRPQDQSKSRSLETSNCHASQHKQLKFHNKITNRYPPLGREAAGDPETVRPQQGRAPATRARSTRRIRLKLGAIPPRPYCGRVESKRLPEERGRGSRDPGRRGHGRHGWGSGCGGREEAVRAVLACWARSRYRGANV